MWDYGIKNVTLQVVKMIDVGVGCLESTEYTCVSVYCKTSIPTFASNLVRCLTYNVLSANALNDVVKRLPHLYRILESLCQSVVLSMCPIVSSQYLLNCSAIFFFITKLGMVLYYNKVMCHAEKLFTIFNVKDTARACIIKI